MTCILCEIAAGAEPAVRVHVDDDVLAIHPLRPMTPVHVLVYPRRHADDLTAYLLDDPEGAGRLMRRAVLIATDLGLGGRGYRLAWNFGPDTAQRILHPHLHLLGGRRLEDRLA